MTNHSHVQVSLIVGLRERFSQQPCTGMSVDVRIHDPKTAPSFPGSSKRSKQNSAWMNSGATAQTDSQAPQLQQIQSVLGGGNGQQAQQQSSQVCARVCVCLCACVRACVAGGDPLKHLISPIRHVHTNACCLIIFSQ